MSVSKLSGLGHAVIADHVLSTLQGLLSPAYSASGQPDRMLTPPGSIIILRSTCERGMRGASDLVYRCVQSEDYDDERSTAWTS